MADFEFGPVDYTSRDYAALRDDLIAAVEARLPEWSGGDDVNDYLRALLEGFAFVGDINNYYIDRAANEAFLATASMRSSLLNISRTFGYSPSGPIAASVTLTLANSGGSSVSIPAGTQFTGTYNRDGVQTVVTFESTEDVTLGASSVASVLATEGSTARGSTTLQGTGDPIGVLLYRPDGASVSDGTPDQRFVIAAKPIIEGSVRVWVHPPTGTPTVADGVEYFEISNLIDSKAFDRVFSVERNADDSVDIVFGDGASGFIPPSGYLVRATYRTGLGSGGNVLANTINSTGLRPDGSTLPATVSVSHVDAAVGGIDAESNDDIRDKAYRALRTKNRAVTLQDFEDLAKKAPGMSRAKAIGSAMSNVLIYVAPYGSVGDDQPGYTTDTLTVSNVVLASNVATFTTTTDHGLSVGQTVNVAGTLYPFDGTWTVASVPTSATITVAITSANVSSTVVSGTMTTINSESATFTDLRNALILDMADAVPMGTGVTVAGPTYSDLAIRLTVNLSGSVRQSTVKSAVTAALLAQFSPETTEFGAKIFTSDVVKAAVSVTGVTSALVTTFDRSKTFSLAKAAANNASFENVEDTLVAAPYEIFRLLAQNLVLTISGGIADLS